MKRLVGALVLAAFAAAAAGCMTPNGVQAPVAASAERPWERAQTVVRAAEADLAKGGIRAIRPHVANLEDVLANANQAFSVAGANTNPIYVFTDGQAETVAALLAASNKASSAPGTQVVAIDNPYVIASYFLGTYYNEVGRPQDALRALDAGLALPTAVPNSDMGLTLRFMLSERGVALAALMRWQDSLQTYDRALAISGLPNGHRALFLRGRGFALIELNRLDEAEQAYSDSLAVEPNNPRAQQELTYIQRLRAGGPMAPVELFMPPPSR